VLAVGTTSAVVNVPEPKWSAVLVVKDQFQVVTAKALLGAKAAPRVMAAAPVLKRLLAALTDKNIRCSYKLHVISKDMQR
jgi:hypothetical protein